GIGEAEVNELDFVVLHHLHHISDGLGHQKLLSGLGRGVNTSKRIRRAPLGVHPRESSLRANLDIKDCQQAPVRCIRVSLHV
ncbi:MAG: hypothetical protein ACOVLH_11610, partial [Roseateles sp.]